MTGFARDNAGLVFPLTLATEVNYIKLHIESRLRLIKGEWFRNVDAGVPWYSNDIVGEDEAIMGQRNAEGRIRSACYTAISETPGVVLAELTDFAFENRDLRVRYKATLYNDEPIGAEVTV